uniref:Putative collagen alpha-1vii chain n=1 Tax=Amblyomma aureolatum TaxID=187763 RepID=A0A1E1XDD0_9ACAR
MKPWTNYTVLVRPFYTESGRPQRMYKLGRAAKVVFRTLSAEPDIPGLVSVQSAQQRNVVLNVIGPSAWNSEPSGFHVRWEATSERQGPQGELDITLTSEWSMEENTVNVTLPLQGGMDYRVFVSAVGADGFGSKVRSPETDLEVSVPLDSYEVSAYAVGPSKAFVHWRSSEIVDNFKVTVYIDDGVDTLRVQSTRYIKAKGKVTSKHSIPVPGLLPWTYYVVSLEGCWAEKCSDAVNTTFRTPPEAFPAPSFTGVTATGASSFQVSWQFPQSDPRLFDGFRVRYCPMKVVASCVLVYTNENILKVGGLDPETTVDVYVAADYKHKDGRHQRGPEATASVTTWSNVPAVSVKSEGSIEEGAGSFMLSWTCTNSSVDYFQYRFANHDQWTTCNDSVEFDAVAANDADVRIASGYLRLTHPEEQSSFSVWVRGCNSYGCGREDTAQVYLLTTGPSPLSEVAFTPKENGAQLRWNRPGFSGYQGVDVTWICNGIKTVTYNQWFIGELPHPPFRVLHSQYYWHDREPTEHYEKYITSGIVTGLPTDAENCEFYVSAYKDEGESRYYSLPVRATLE